MREIGVRITEQVYYHRKYWVEDDFVVNDASLEYLVNDDECLSEGDNGNRLYSYQLTSDHPVQPNDLREEFRKQYAGRLDELRRRFGDGDVIDDHRGGNCLAAPYGDGLLCFTNAIMNPGAKPGGWRAWYEVADGKVVATTNDLVPVARFEMIITQLLNAVANQRGEWKK